MTLLPVACTCGWTGRRKPGNIVWCPECGGPAGYQSEHVATGLEAQELLRRIDAVAKPTSPSDPAKG